MRRKRTLGLCILLAAGICLSGCGNKAKETKLETGDISNESVVMKVGSEPVRFSEVKDYCYFLKCQYEGSFGEQLWEYPLSKNETIGDQAKQEIVNMITQLKIICNTAKRQNVKLTADEMDEALRKAEELVGNASKADKAEYSLNVQDISEIYQENALADKMFYIATDDADTTVSDEEARQMSLQYIEVMTNGTDRNGTAIQMDQQAKKKALTRAQKLQTEAASRTDFQSFAQKNTDAANVDLTIGKDTDALESKVVENVMAMSDGQTSDVIEGEQGYYIVHCVKATDEEATYKKKEEIIKQRQTDMFMKKYAKWLEDQNVDINQTFWNEFSI